jgi:GTP-binding protein HflX
MESQRRSLEEALNVDLLLHVVDASHPDAPDFLAAVDEVLGDTGGAHREQILVLNKADALEDRLDAAHLVHGRPEPHVLVSARTGDGLEELDSMILERLDRRSALVEITVPFTAGGALAVMRKAASILSEDHDAERGTILVARVPDRELGNLRRHAGEDVRIEILEPATERFFAEDPAAEATPRPLEYLDPEAGHERDPSDGSERRA